MKSETETVTEWEQQNVNKPLWTRAPKDVTDDEYNTFFTTTFKEFVPPMARNHFNVEGTYEFSGLLFIPGMAPFDQFQERDAKKSSIRLFVKRVFISDQFDEQLLPKYLAFVKGIVDSSDLPLNVSREILQVRLPCSERGTRFNHSHWLIGRRVSAAAHIQRSVDDHVCKGHDYVGFGAEASQATEAAVVQESRVVRVIRKQLVKRCIDMISDLAAKGEEEYEKFWSQFGRNVKLGVIDDPANQSKLASLMRVRALSQGLVIADENVVHCTVPRSLCPPLQCARLRQLPHHLVIECQCRFPAPQANEIMLALTSHVLPSCSTSRASQARCSRAWTTTSRA